jgi:methionyl aminopeptidase
MAIIIKTPDELVRMRASAQVAARIRDAVAAKVSPGVSTGELGDYALELMKKEGAKSAFFGYRGFPGQICTSVNAEVVHGIPSPQRKILRGDIVSVDIGVVHNGFIGDTATTVMVGVTDPEVIRLISVAEEALLAGIKQARSGNRLGDVSNAIETVVKRAGFAVVKDFVGHGVGRSMHEDPQIPNYGPAGRGPKLKSGMTLAIEPMVNMISSEVDVLEDGWTVLTRDRRPSAHVEHTVAVREGDAEILTLRQN